MKKILLLFLFPFFTMGISAQNQGLQDKNNNWLSMGLNAYTGTNQFSGVEGFCLLTTCNGIETVFIKLVNYNPYPVKAGWKDLIITTDNKMLSALNETVIAQDSVTIPAKSQITGDCSGNNARLRLKLSDFGTDAENFRNIIASGFDFVIIHSTEH